MRAYRHRWPQMEAILCALLTALQPSLLRSGANHRSVSIRHKHHHQIRDIFNSVRRDCPNRLPRQQNLGCAVQAWPQLHFTSVIGFSSSIITISWSVFGLNSAMFHGYCHAHWAKLGGRIDGSGDISFNILIPTQTIAERRVICGKDVEASAANCGKTLGFSEICLQLSPKYRFLTVGNIKRVFGVPVFGQAQMR